MIKRLRWTFTSSVTVSVALSSCLGAPLTEAPDSSRLSHPHRGSLVELIERGQMLQLMTREEAIDVLTKDDAAPLQESAAAVSSEAELVAVLCPLPRDEAQPCQSIFRNVAGEQIILSMEVLEQLYANVQERSEWMHTHQLDLFKTRGMLVVGWSIAPTAVFLQFASHDYMKLSKYLKKELMLGLSVAGLIGMVAGTKAYFDYERRLMKQAGHEYWLSKAQPGTLMPPAALTPKVGAHIYGHLIDGDEDELTDKVKKYKRLSLAHPMRRFTLELAQEYNETIILFEMQAELIHSRCLEDQSGSVELACSPIYPFEQTSASPS